MNPATEVFTGYVKSVGSREEAAKRLGISVGMVGHIENGRRGVSPRVARAIETDTNGFIDKAKLRPDLWGDADLKRAS